MGEKHSTLSRGEHVSRKRGYSTWLKHIRTPAKGGLTSSIGLHALEFRVEAKFGPGYTEERVGQMGGYTEYIRANAFLFPLKFLCKKKERFEGDGMVLM